MADISTWINKNIYDNKSIYDDNNTYLSYRKLSDIVREFHDPSVSNMSITQEWDAVPTLDITAYCNGLIGTECCADKKNDTNKNNKENEGDNKMNTNMFNGMFGKVQNGMCRLSMNGGIAVKTSNGYKTYNIAKKRLVNCSNFVFDIADEFFFVIPTNKVEEGDIVLMNGKPKCVIKTDDNTITVINYEDSVVETVLPERHVFMGNTYFYGKIISMFGDDITKNNGNKGTKKIMNYMMMSEMMKGSNNSSNGFGNMLPFMLMSGGNFGDIFDGLFNFDLGLDDEDEDKTPDKK